MLSGLSQAPSWKCKYWVLSGDSLYYYSSGRDTAAGVIDLTQVWGCHFRVSCSSLLSAGQGLCRGWAG